jgi:hypothetical protein
MSYKYKNVSGNFPSLDWFWRICTEQELRTDKAVENPNFQYLGAEEVQPEAQTPTIDPTPQEEQTQEQPDNQENQ